MTEDQIKYMVDRFLCWRLPKNFSPDAGISYTRPDYPASVDATPSGTNLLDGTQAEAMVRHMIEGLPGAGTPDTLNEDLIIMILKNRSWWALSDEAIEKIIEALHTVADLKVDDDPVNRVEWANDMRDAM